MKKRLGVLLLLLVAVILASCGDSSTSTSGKVVLPEGQTNLVLELEEIVNVTPSVDVEGVDVKFTYTSSNKSVVNVSNYGAIMAVTLGEAKVTVAATSIDGTKTFEAAEIAVKVEPVIHFSGDVNSATIFAPGEDPVTSPGETYQISPMGNPSTDSFTYTSASTGVATVDANGLVTAVAAGTSVITVKGGNNATATFTINVVALSNDPIVLNFKLTIPEPITQEHILIFIVGNFNNWTPGDMDYVLTKVDDLHYEITLQGIDFLKPGVELQYKFTLGSTGSRGKWYGEKVNGSPTDNRKLKLNGGTYDYELTAWPWESTNVPVPGAVFIPGQATITWEVTLNAPLAAGQWIGIVGPFEPDGNDKFWNPVNPDMRLTQDATNNKLYRITLSTSAMQGGETLPYKFVIGNASTTGWGDLLHELGDGAEAGNIQLFLNGGEYLVAITAPALDGPKAALDVEDPVAVGDTQGTYTFVITLATALQAGEYLAIVGNFGENVETPDPLFWNPSNTDLRMTKDATNDLVYSITLATDVMQHGYNLEFKFVIGNASSNGWDNLVHNMDSVAGGNLSTLISSGEHTLEIELVAHESTYRVQIVQEPARLTLVVTLDVALNDGEWLTVIGALPTPNDWKINVEALRLTKSATNELEYSITLDFDLAPGSVEIKFGVGNASVVEGQWDTLVKNIGNDAGGNVSVNLVSGENTVNITITGNVAVVA